MSEVRVWIRDGNLRRVAEVDNYTSFDAQIVYNDVSTWKLIIPRDSIVAEAFLATQWDDGMGGIEAELDGEHLIAGPLWTFENTKVANKGPTLTIVGFSDEIWLRRRTILPVPSGSPYHPQFDIRHQKPDEAMRTYVEHNLSDAADLNGRRLQNKANEDILHVPPATGIGTDSTWWARFDNLLEMLQLIANSFDLRFRIIPCPTTEFRLDFVVDQPTDKTDIVRFSMELGNLDEYTTTKQAPTANYLIGGGIGEGEGRLIVELEDSASVDAYGRIEEFVDMRQVHDTAAMTTHLSSEMATRTDLFAVVLTPVSSPNIQYLSDYELGDTVSLSTEDDEFTANVGQVDVHADGNGGVTTTPSVNSLGLVPRQSSPILSQVRGLQLRLSRLERFGENPAQSGMVMFWDGDIADLQDPWKVCDGTNEGAPDLRDKFILVAGLTYAYGDSGGSAELPDHTHEMPHDHGDTGEESVQTTVQSGSGADVANDNHVHATSDTNTPSTGFQPPNTDSMPPWYALYAIKYLPLS